MVPREMKERRKEKKEEKKEVHGGVWKINSRSDRV